MLYKVVLTFESVDEILKCDYSNASYYNLIYPCISYGILAWGRVYKTHIRKFKRNKTILLDKYCFFTIFGSETEKAKPFLNLLGLLTVNNIYRLQVLKCLPSWHKGLLPKVLDNMFQYASNMHNYNTSITKHKHTTKHYLYKPSVRKNVGKQLLSFMATDIWKDLSTSLKKTHAKCVCISEANYTLSTIRTTNQVIFS